MGKPGTRHPALRLRGHVTPPKLTQEDIDKLVAVFLILDRWKREDDERAALERRD